MIDNMSNRIYILGGAQTDFERNWTKEGKGVIALLRAGCPRRSWVNF